MIWPMSRNDQCPTSPTHIALLVRDYDDALPFYVGKLGFTLVEETCIPAQDKRWVTIGPLGALEDITPILLARAGA